MQTKYIAISISLYKVPFSQPPIHSMV